MNEVERYDSILAAAQLLEMCEVGAIWFELDKYGKRTIQVFRYDDIDKARKVGDAFSKTYAAVRARYFPEGEQMDSESGKVSKG